jgi:DNA polymerase-2
VCQLEVATPPDIPEVRNRLHAGGIDTFEADVRFPVRYLIERGIKGGCEIEGDAAPGVGVSWVFDNPQLRPASVQIEPRVLSFDIETDAKAERLLAIALYGLGVDEILIVDGSARVMPENAIGFANERAALDRFCARIVELDPDGLLNMSTSTSVLQHVLHARHPATWGVGALRLRALKSYFGSGHAAIPGAARDLSTDAMPLRTPVDTRLLRCPRGARRARRCRRGEPAH